MELDDLECPNCGFCFKPINPPYKSSGQLITFCPRCLMYFEVKDKK